MKFLLQRNIVIVIMFLLVARSVHSAQNEPVYYYKDLPYDARYIIFEKLLDTARTIDEVDQLVWRFVRDTKEIAFVSSSEIQNLIAKEKIQINLDETLHWPTSERIDIVHGSGINARDFRGNTVLIYISNLDERVHPEIIQLARTIINYGADVNATNSSGRTALMQATLRNNDKLMALLLQNFANINLQDRNGKTALMLAATMQATHIPTALEVLL